MTLSSDTLAERPTSVRFLVLAALCVAASLAYLCRNSIGVAESTIRQELELTERQMGWVIAIFFLSYALAQIPTGWCADYFGSRRSIPVFALAWSMATAIMGSSAGMPMLILTRLGNGIAQAGLFPASNATIGKWFPDTRRAVACGSLASFMSIGGAVGVAATGILVTAVGWRLTFAGYGLLGVFFALIFFGLFRDVPAEHRWANPAERSLIGEPTHSKKKVPGAWLGIYLSPPTWWICGQQFCRGAGQIFFASWFATYLQETRGVSVAQSGILNSLPLAGIVAGALIGGMVSDYVLAKTGSRRWARSGVAAISMLLCAMFVVIAYFIANPVLAVSVIACGTFCAAVGGPCAYTVTIDLGGEYTAVLFGTMNMIGNLGAFAFIRVVPEVTDSLGWDAVLGVFAVLYLGAAVCWLLVNPNGSILDRSLLHRSRC